MHNVLRLIFNGAKCLVFFFVWTVISLALYLFCDPGFWPWQKQHLSLYSVSSEKRYLDFFQRGDILKYRLHGSNRKAILLKKDVIASNGVIHVINRLMTNPPEAVGDEKVLTLNAPIAIKVVCFSRLLKCLRSLYGKQFGPRSDCSYRSSLFRVHAVCFYT